MKRYERQTLLPEIGTAGELTLQNARVLIVGLGGLGAPTALYLAGAGIGTLGLVDGDQVNLSNLHRQVLYRMSDIGEAKVHAAKKNLLAFNPEIKINVYAEELMAANALQIAGNYDLIIDGSDRFSTKFLINDLSLKINRPWIYASAAQWDGQIALFDPRRKMLACYRCFRPEMPKVQIQNCAESGIIGPVVGILGVQQALLAMQVILEIAPDASVLKNFDGRNQEWMDLKLTKNSHCKSCSISADDLVIADKVEFSCEVLGVQKINAQDLKKEMPKLLSTTSLIDVRETNEWNAGHIEGAIHWSLSRLEKNQFPDVPHARPVLLYCQAGARSAKAAVHFQKAGYREISELAGGMLAWQKA
jgi:molybdopterin/thiamine biosynthesis adenylyltransferase/rhodanese-related sulfurtransferase